MLDTGCCPWLFGDPLQFRLVVTLWVVGGGGGGELVSQFDRGLSERRNVNDHRVLFQILRIRERQNVAPRESILADLPVRGIRSR